MIKLSREAVLNLAKILEAADVEEIGLFETGEGRLGIEATDGGGEWRFYLVEDVWRRIM